MQKRPRILLVDENAQNLSELESVLARLNVDFARAQTVEQALRFVKEYDFCMAIVSADLPGVDIDVLLKRLCRRPPSARLAVILLYSTYPAEAEARKAYTCGVADVLFRPLIPSILVDKAIMAIALYEQENTAKLRAARTKQRKNADVLFRWLSQSMQQIAQAMASTLDMMEVPDLVLEQLPAVVPYERGSILLREGEALRIVAQRGFPPGWPISDARIPIRQGDVFQQIVETRQALLIDDVTATSAWQQAEGLPLNYSWLGVPLVARDRVIGMVSLTRQERAAFKPEEVSFIAASASQAAVALVNAALLNDLKRFNDQLEYLVRERTEELKSAYSRLEKIDRAKSSFISVTEHELRTPLTLIQGYASLLDSMLKEDKTASELTRGIMTGEQRLLEVVNNMLTVSKIDNQVLELRKTRIDVWLIIKIVRAEFKAALSDRCMVMDIDDSEALPEIYADTELLGKLFRNLFSNAIKYTPDGGSIRVTARNIPTSRLTPGPFLPGTFDIDDFPQGDQPAIEILVSDNGIGIDPPYHELIFEKFYQMGVVDLHSSGKTKFKGGGPGLGLAIARGIAQAHKGKIWVESPGHDEAACPGSCFHVVLPVS
jgi:signal transduction histidine kinase